MGQGGWTKKYFLVIDDALSPVLDNIFVLEILSCSRLPDMNRHIQVFTKMRYEKKCFLVYR